MVRIETKISKLFWTPYQISLVTWHLLNVTCHWYRKFLWLIHLQDIGIFGFQVHHEITGSWSVYQMCKQLLWKVKWTSCIVQIFFHKVSKNRRHAGTFGQTFWHRVEDFSYCKFYIMSNRCGATPLLEICATKPKKLRKTCQFLKTMVLGFKILHDLCVLATRKRVLITFVGFSVPNVI